jgi:DNA-binding protein YbaB
MPDLGSLLGQAQAMMANAAAAADAEVEGSAGGGMVRVVVNGRFEFSSVHIDPAEVELLEDLVLAALRDASAQLTARQSQALGGLDLGGLGGLLGG